MSIRNLALPDLPESERAHTNFMYKGIDFIGKLKDEINEFERSFHSFVTAESLLNRKIETIPTLINPIIQKVGLVAIAGSSDTGKSSFLRQLCMETCAGNLSFLGFDIEATHHSAIYVSTEDDEEAVSYLLNKQNKSLNIDSSKLSKLRFIFDSENLIENLDEQLNKLPADLVVIDAFTDIYGKSMNEANQIRTFLNEYGQLAKKHKCLIIFLHHCGKRTENEPPSKNNLLGSQAFEAKMRLVMELRSDKHDPSIKHLCLVKGNYLSSEFKHESYQLTFDENMTFENTNSRVPFELLKTDNENGDREKYELIKEYMAQGLTQEETAGKVGYKSKGSVSKLIAKYEKN